MEYVKKHKNIFLAILIAFSTYLLFFGPLLSSKNYFWGDDAKGEYIPARVYFHEKVTKEHTFPFWTERMFSGFPIYADLENSYLNPINDLSILVFGPLLSYKVLHLLEYLIGSLSLYYFLKRKKFGLLGYAAANVIFYFNTFMLTHQIHFNIIMAFYLLPTAILLADLYIEKRQLRYIFLQSFVIANAVLWGHMQSAIIVGMGAAAYMIVFSFKKIKLAPFVFYFIALLLLVGIETFPQVLPSYRLYESIGGRERLDYMAGVLKPSMVEFTFVPYLMGDHKSFSKRGIGTSYNYNETYIYLGISAVFLAGLALLLSKRNRLYIFSYLLIWVFLVFSFKFLNKISSSRTLIVPMFRYWIRTTVLASFGVAVLAGVFIDQTISRLSKMSFKKFLMGFLFILLPVLYILGWQIEDGISGANKITSFNYIKNYPYYRLLAGVLITSSVVFLLSLWTKKISKKNKPKIILFLKIAFLLIIFFDLFYFSRDVLDFRIADITKYNYIPASTELENKRVIAENEGTDCMETVYYKNWGPFGCSQFKESEYHEYFKDNIRSFELDSEKDLEKLKNAGIATVIDKKGIIFPINDKKIDIIKNNLDGEYLEKKEGKIIMIINNPSDTVINTFLKYNSSWRVLVDDKRVEIVKNEIFFDFPLSEGMHVVEIYYYPKAFVQGLIISLFSSLIFFVLYYFFKKELYKKILN